MTPIQYYTYTYPQLTLDIFEGQSKSEEYLNITRKCIFPDKLDFPLAETGMEERLSVDTPAGSVEVLYLPDRMIFERFVRVLAYRCEPVEIPASTGAMMISGINNLRKYLAREADYKDYVLLISRGCYSNIPADKVGYDEAEWLDISKKIRIYHESTHFVTRKLFLDHKEAIRDEVIADSIGVIGALGYFDKKLEHIIFGIDSNSIDDGARIRNYVEPQEVEEAAKYSLELIEKLDVFYKEYLDKNKMTMDQINPLELVVAVEEAYIT